MRSKTLPGRTCSDRLPVAGLAGLVVLCCVVPTQAAVWGSFDATRVNYSAGMLTGGAHTTLRSIIEGAGGTIASPAPTLTEAYLDTVDVFYTSLLSQTTGVLSADEQTALNDWIDAGGTLIVTADVIALDGYESFTAAYGVTGYEALRHQDGNGSTTTMHPITEGVDTYRYSNESTFVYGADAMLLGDNGLGSDFMIVMEAETGFTAGGRLLVLGDHNVLANSSIGQEDNTRLATNIAVWAGLSPCPEDLDGNGAVDFADVLAIVVAWGATEGPEDLDGSGVVDFGDIVLVLSGWGPCD